MKNIERQGTDLRRLWRRVCALALYLFSAFRVRFRLETVSGKGNYLLRTGRTDRPYGRLATASGST